MVLSRSRHPPSPDSDDRHQLRGMVNRQFGKRQLGDITVGYSLECSRPLVRAVARCGSINDRSASPVVMLGGDLVEIDRRTLVTQLHRCICDPFCGPAVCESDCPEAGQFFWSTVAKTASARRRGQVGTNWSPARDGRRGIKRHGTRDGDRRSLGPGSFRQASRLRRLLQRSASGSLETAALAEAGG